MTQPTAVDISVAINRMTSNSSYFAEAYGSLNEEWRPDVPPTTIVFSMLGRAFCRHANRTTEEQMVAIWKTVEELILNGDDAVKNAVATGFLEAVLSESSAGRCSISSVSGHFGPATIAYCKAWDEFTGCKTEGVY